MKKILLLLTAFSIILLGLQSSYAITVERDFEFTITSINTGTQFPNLNVIATTSTADLFEELITSFPLEVDTATSSAEMDIFITKDGVSYPGKLSYYDLSASSFPNYYEISTVINNWTVRFEIWDGTYTYQTKTVLSNQIDIFANDLTVTNKLNSLQGTWKITAEVEATPDPGEGVNVSSNFNLIPSTIGKLDDAAVPNMVGYVYFEHVSSNIFEVYILLAGTQYNLGQMELPGVNELNKMPLSPGIYWTDSNKRHIYYEFQQPISEVPLNLQKNIFLSDINQVKGFRPFVTINLTDTTYSFQDKLTLYAGFYGGLNGEAFADVVFPFELDQLLSITMEYSYRWQTLWGWPVVGGYTAWTEVSVTRYLDEVIDMRSAWQHFTAYLFGGIVTGAISQLTSWGDTIEQLSVNTTYKQDYTAHINNVRQNQGKTALTVNQIFPTGSDVYRVYLDTFNQPNYTGYQIDDNIVIMQALYQVDGVIYLVPYSDITQGGSFGGGGSGIGGQDENNWDFSFITSFFSNIPTEYIFIGLLAIGVIFWKPIKRTLDNIQKLIKNPKDLVLLIVIIAAVMYFLGYL